MGLLEEPRLPSENRGGILWHHRIYVEPRASLKPRRLREPRRDLEVPVVLRLLSIAGSRVNVVVVRRVLEELVQAAEDVLPHPSEGGPLRVREVLKRHLMGLRQDPRLEREPRRVWREGDERFVFRDDPLLLLEFCLDDLAVDARAAGGFVVPLGGVHLFHDAPWDDWRCDELRVGMAERGARPRAVVLENQDVLE